MAQFDIYAIKKYKETLEEEIENLKRSLLKCHGALEDMRLLQGKASGLNDALIILRKEVPFIFDEEKSSTFEHFLLVSEEN